MRHPGLLLIALLVVSCDLLQPPVVLEGEGRRRREGEGEEGEGDVGEGEGDTGEGEGDTGEGEGDIGEGEGEGDIGEGEGDIGEGEGEGEGEPCAATDFVCTDGGCVSGDFACDGLTDCADASDEPPLNTNCSPVPPGWTCPAAFFTDAECDCGCGALDPACGSNPTASACQFCNDTVCRTGTCPANIDPADISQCL